MFTVCPKCALILVVTAEDLRVAQGYVRCGRCSSVFNALARLSDEQPQAEKDAAAGAHPRDTEAELPAAAPPRAAPPAAPPAPVSPPASSVTAAPAAAAAAEEDAIPESALEFDPAKTDVTAVFVEPPPDPQFAAATGTFRAMLAANQELAPPEEDAASGAEDATSPDEADSQVDVEIDQALLAEILKDELPAAEPAAAPPESPPQPAPEPPPAGQAATVPTHPAAPAARASAAPRVAPPPRPAEAAAARRTAPPAPRSAPAAAPEAAPAPAQRDKAPVAVPREASHAAVPPEAAPATDEAPALRPVAFETPRPRPRRARRARPAQPWRVRLQPYLWRAATVVALLVLGAQVLDHHRDQLAASERFSRQLTALYAFFGVRLTPHWDLHAYDVRQLGASLEPGGSGLITVRASIKNGARRPQPLPLLRVTLQDRFGNRIAARDVAPRFYLPRTAAAGALLPPGERIDAEMGFVDPGANAVGFEIDACLPAAGGEVTCANDAGSR